MECNSKWHSLHSKASAESSGKPSKCLTKSNSNVVPGYNPSKAITTVCGVKVELFMPIGATEPAALDFGMTTPLAVYTTHAGPHSCCADVGPTGPAGWENPITEDSLVVYDRKLNILSISVWLVGLYCPPNMKSSRPYTEGDLFAG